MKKITAGRTIKLFALTCAALAALSFAGCDNMAGGGSKKPGTESDTHFTPTPDTSSGITAYKSGNVSFNMVRIDAVTNGTIGDNTTNDNKERKVSLSAYLIGETEVTQELWQKVMGNNPSVFKNEPADGEKQEKRPVENVTWFQCIAFCNELTKKVPGLGEAECVYMFDGKPYTKENAEAKEVPAMDLTKKGFRLPTEAEWEWAAKGGTNDKWPGTNDQETVKDYAWYDKNSNEKTHEVKKKKPNGYGLYDMSGNVSEKCWDWYNDESTPAGGLNPVGDESGMFRVERGGHWEFNAGGATCAFRDSMHPSLIVKYIGLRVAMSNH